LSRGSDLEHRAPAIRSLADTAYVDLEDFASELALSIQQFPGRLEVELVGIDERRILVFPGTRTASIAGVAFELSEPVRETGGVAWISRVDAVSIRALWRGTDPLLQPLVVDPPRRTVVIPNPPLPFSSSAGRRAAGASAAARAPKPKPGRWNAGRASSSERRAWGVTLTRTWKYLVIHHSASPSGSAASFHKAHKDRGWDGLGYHFVIGNGRGAPDGAVQVGYRWQRQKTGAHAGDKLMNERGIGICLVGNFETGRPSARQMASLTRLCQYLSVHCGISEHGLKRHKDVRGTACPGKYFPANWTFRERSTRSSSARARR